jgi:hypothetical protein
MSIHHHMGAADRAPASFIAETPMVLPKSKNSGQKPI